MIRRYLNYTLLLALLAFGLSCKSKNDLEAFKEAKYSLAGISEINVNGINMLEKKGPEDFSFTDAAALFTAFSDNKLHATSTLGLNVELDENDRNRTMTVTQLKWQLLIDDKQALSGLVNEPVELHHGLNTITVKTPVAFTTEKGQSGLEHLIRLAALLNQEEGRKPDIKLQIKPTLQTSLGAFELPAFISISR